MKHRLFALTSLTAILTGCASHTDARVTNPTHPGPAVGQVVGQAVGVVAGNVAGTAVGAGEGFVNGVQKPFKTEKRYVRTWKTEKTSDGRTIQVAVDTEVDEQGRPVATTEAK